MNALVDSDPGMLDAAERSAVYRTLAQAFTYPGAQSSAWQISGAEYNDAFDPSVSEAACSLREGAHSVDDQTALFEELVRFYEFFGLARGEAAEMPDHLSVELEFMHFLTHLESRVGDEPESLASVRRAQHDFIARHLARLVQAVRSKLKSQDPACVALVAVCDDFVNAELARAKVYAEA